MAFYGVVHCFSNGGADCRFNKGYCVSMFIVPIVALCRLYPKHGDAGIVHTFGKPGFQHRIPEFLDQCRICTNGSLSKNTKKIRILGALEQKLNFLIFLDMLVFMAVACA